MESDEQSVGRDGYIRFLRVIRAQTGGPSQHPMADVTGISTTLNQTNVDINTSNALTVGQRKDHVVRWVDDGSWTNEGAGQRTRLALTVEGFQTEHVVGSYPYGKQDAETIRRILEIEADREEPAKEVISWANQHLTMLNDRHDANLRHPDTGDSTEAGESA